MTRLFGVLLALCLGAAVQAQVPVPSIDDYAAMTNMSSVRISPNGERLVFISGETRADRNIIVYSLVGEGSHVIDGGDDQVLVRVGWLNDDHIVATYSERRDIVTEGERADIFRNYVIRYDGSDNWELNNYASLANRDLSDPDTVLVWLPVLQDNRGSPAAGGDVEQAEGLFRQGLDRDRNRRRLFIGDGGFNYILNAQNEPIVRYTQDGAEFELWSRHGGDWERVYSENLERERFRFGARRSDRWTGRMTYMAGLDITGRYGYFTSRVNDDRFAVFRFDFETNEIEGPVVQSELADVGSFIEDWRTNAIIGVRWAEERQKVLYFDPEFADLQAQLEGFFPSSNVDIVSWDADFRKVVVSIEGGLTAGAYYLLDRQTGDVTLLAQSRPRIPDEAIAPWKWCISRRATGSTCSATSPCRRDARLRTCRW